MSKLADLSVKRVLIYRLGSLGDTVVALPSLHLIARAYPNAERRMLTNLPVSAKAAAAVAVLGGSGMVHGYFAYRVGTRSLSELALLWWKLVRWRPQVVVYLAAFRGEAAVRRDSRFFRLCGIRRQVGFPLTKAMQEHDRDASGQMFESEASRLLRNLTELGEARVEESANWDLRLTREEKAKAREVLAGVAPGPIIAVSLGTKIQANDWGAENWRSLLASLAVKFSGYMVVLCGVAEESAACEAAARGWRAVASGPESVVNLCGRLTPRETAAVFELARLFIGHDSGPMHLAAAVQTPCVAIFAARNPPGVWFPPGRHHRVIYHRVDCSGCGLKTCVVERKKCIASIAVGEVVDAVIEVLGPL